MNVLFVNYGNFTTNSLNHIAGFAAALSARGHDCVVAVPAQKETLAVIPDPRFTAATYAEVLARPAFFRDDRPADVIHAWTPREGVRKFVLAYQRLQAGTRLVVHLEDNEEHLIATFGATPLGTLRELPQQNYPFPLVDGLPHPVRYHHLLRLADAVTVIVDRLAEFAPPDRPVHLLQPGVDFAFYHPRPADAALRRELGLRDGEKVIVFTGSVTFANLAEMRALYDAVKLLNEGGTPTRLVRTGITHPDFASQLGYSPAAFVLELGFVEKAKLPALLALADVLVQPGTAGAFNDYRLPSKLPEFLSSGPAGRAPRHQHRHPAHRRPRRPAAPHRHRGGNRRRLHAPVPRSCARRKTRPRRRRVRPRQLRPFRQHPPDWNASTRLSRPRPRIPCGPASGRPSRPSCPCCSRNCAAASRPCPRPVPMRMRPSGAPRSRNSTISAAPAASSTSTCNCAPGRSPTMSATPPACSRPSTSSARMWPCFAPRPRASCASWKPR